MDHVGVRFEAHRWGYSRTAARDAFCAGSSSADWYRARLVNRGGYSLVKCSATGYDARGVAVFHGLLPFTLGGIRGLFAGNGVIRFYWFLPRQTPAPVKRYATSCSTSPWPI